MATLTQHREAERRLALLKRIDFWMLGAVAFLIAAGLISLYSFDAANPSASYFKKQLLHIVIGFIPFAVFFFVDTAVWRRYSKVLYAVNLALLSFVLLKGHASGGAQRWIQLGPFQFQPSELAKILVVLTLASFLMSRADRIRKFSTFALSLLHVSVPLALVFFQPHLGATLVILVAWLSVCVAAGVPLRFLVGAFAVAAFALVLAIRVPGVMHDYQRERVKALLSPNSQGNGYQTLRAEMAFGVGGLTGAGFLHGAQKQSHFIPEQQNDFIFTIVGEEGGLLGCSLVLFAFAVFLYRVWFQMIRSSEPYHKMLVGGIFGILAFHTVVNLGMNLQLLPVVGLWLPFMSYGGSAMWLCMGCLGLLLNMGARQRPVLF